MKPYQPNPGLLLVVMLVTALALTGASLGRALAETFAPSPTNLNPIPMDQIGAVAQKQYSGDGLSIVAAKDGALLRCVIQRLDGEATREGLWLNSTVPDQANDRFRVKATAVGQRVLPEQGVVTMDGQTVRFSRPGLVEEYSVSMDGVRQDFLVLEKPATDARNLVVADTSPLHLDLGRGQSRLTSAATGSGELRVELSVTGAKVEQTAHGAQLVLEKSGRKIAYSQLKVTDADVKELVARIELVSNSELPTPHSELAMTVVVNDAQASYPIRIDPTFSDANWISMGIPGTDGSVLAAVAADSGHLYIGGSFTNVGDIFATNIARWNGSSWSPLGPGIKGQVRALAFSAGDLYAGGSFTAAGGASATNIARWDGTNWSSLGLGMSPAPDFPYFGSVDALATAGGNLYAGGSFTNAGTVAASRIARWNGSSWSALGSGIDRKVFAIAVAGDDVYAGGSFSTAGGIYASSVAKWNGSSWSALGLGVGGSVRALAVSGQDLYVGGSFVKQVGVNATNIVRWDGTNWWALPGISAAPSGTYWGGEVHALALLGGAVHAGGYFTNAGGEQAYSISKWNGSNWVSLGEGINYTVRALAVSGSNLYAGGEFTKAGTTAARSIAKWNDGSWSALGKGLAAMPGGDKPVVQALATANNEVYAGGYFFSAGSVAGNRIAKWNGSAWAALGSGISAPPGDPYYSFRRVNALGVLGNDLYAGGHFTMAGSIPVTNIAKWDGISWSALGSGLGGSPDGFYLNGQVYAIAVMGSNIYAGGDFTNAGGVSVNHIAKWDGNNWSALGSGMNSYVSALAVSGSDLYAGGHFTMAGGVAANRIAKWNGSSWSALGSGMSSLVYALALSGTNLYAAGIFTTVNGIPAKRVARWNGSSWFALGSGMDNTVHALAVSGGDLYAGGRFSTAGGVVANGIARWSSSGWSAMGSGMVSGEFGPAVLALAVAGDELYAGGDFSTAGGKVSESIARARIGSKVTFLIPSNSTAYIKFSGVTGYQYDVQRATDFNAPITWTTVTTSPLSPAADSTFTFTDTTAPPGTAYYRAVER